LRNTDTVPSLLTSRKSALPSPSKSANRARLWSGGSPEATEPSAVQPPRPSPPWFRNTETVPSPPTMK